MGKPTGFIQYARRDRRYQPSADRIVHYDEFIIPLSAPEVTEQGARCMDCGIPFCHQGCPVNNLIPDWNDLVYKGDWQAAIEALHSTNNFPEFTGRICPAPCEAACTLNIDDTPVAIKTIECAIVDKAWSSIPTPTSAAISPSPNCAPTTTPWSWPAAASSRATCRCRAGN